MDQKKANERIAMAMLRQCALVWEYCARIDGKVKECELKFADVWNGTGDYRMWKKCPIGHIEVDFEKCEHQELFGQMMQAVTGVEGYAQAGRWSEVKMFFQTSDTDPRMGFGCGYLLNDVFDVTRRFCMGNGCTALMNKAVFGIDDGGKFARLPEVAKVTQRAQKAQKKFTKSAPAKKASGTPNPAIGCTQSANRVHPTAEPTLAERLREALLKQMAGYKVAA